MTKEVVAELPTVKTRRVRRRKFRLLYIAPALAVIALMTWAMASPAGSSPDDDYHLVSIWCANGTKVNECAPGTSAATRTVPQALLRANCYIRKPAESAACQYAVLNSKSTVVTDRGNFLGGYPPLYYAAMNLFVTPNIELSVILMRFVNTVLFVGLGTTLFRFLPRVRRPAFVWGWLASTVPLGLFLIPSNNPSSWAIIGVGTAWLALLGYFETTGRRKIALAAVFVASTFMAAGSRSDAAVYAVMAIAIVAVLAFTRTKHFLIDAILPAVMIVICSLYFLSARQYMSAVSGFSSSSSVGSAAATGAVPHDALSLAAFNLLNVPSLLAGVFGSWALGWFDTALPAVVAIGSLACFIGVAFVGFGRLDRRKAIVLAAVGLALIFIPVYVLTKGGDPVGVEVQPRYMLPLIVVFAGLLMLAPRSRPVRFSRGQLILLVTTLSVVQFVSLHTDMRRYITGTSGQGWNLNAGIQWWWDIPFSPMLVLIVGSLAYAGVVAILAVDVSGRKAQLQDGAQMGVRDDAPVEPAVSLPQRETVEPIDSVEL